MGRTTPWWVWAVLLFLGVAAVRARRPRPPSPEVQARLRELVVERNPRRMSARELRQLPGVGLTLALAVARTRDTHQGAAPLAWEDVPGIGEVRAREIRAWFRARGIEPDPLARGGSDPAARYPLAVDPLPSLALPWLAFLGACGSAPGEPRAGADPARSHAAEPEVRAHPVALAGGTLHALEAGPEDGPPVLLLHGARFSARTWEELGTLALLARAGYHALAIDWPGHGASPDWGTEDAGTLLASVCATLGARVALVAPSLGGRFALEFLEASPERVSAFVGIAPAVAEGFAPRAWSTPTLLVWGEADDVAPPAQGRALAERLHARFELLPGAAHPCYLDRPERFHALLLAFLSETRAPSSER